MNQIEKGLRVTEKQREGPIGWQTEKNRKADLTYKFENLIKIA